MSLKTIVKISSISNLSDARYCAGMGVEMIGFCFDKEKNEYIEPSKVKEIIGWVSGIKIVGEFGKENSLEEINNISNELSLDYIQIDISTHLNNQLNAIDKPVIIATDISYSEIKHIFSIQDKKIEYILFHSMHENIEKEEIDILEGVPSGKMLIGFGLNAENTLSILEKIKPIGIALKGSQEIRPGFKNFDELSDILEALEVED